MNKTLRDARFKYYAVLDDQTSILSFRSRLHAPGEGEDPPPPRDNLPFSNNPPRLDQPPVPPDNPPPPSQFYSPRLDQPPPPPDNPPPPAQFYNQDQVRIQERRETKINRKGNFLISFHFRVRLLNLVRARIWAVSSAVSLFF